MTDERPEAAPRNEPDERPAPGERKAFLLRLPPDLLDAWKRIAATELRSLNAQIELVLREALRRRGGGGAEGRGPESPGP
ncbi:MAG: hypothetical protein AB7T63_17155 [Planctomycetota bacterium]